MITINLLKNKRLKKIGLRTCVLYVRKIVYVLFMLHIVVFVTFYKYKQSNVKNTLLIKKIF